MTEPKPKNDFMKTPAVRIILGVVGAIMVVQGVTQVIHGAAELKEDSKSESSVVHEAAVQSATGTTEFSNDDFSFSYPSSWVKREKLPSAASVLGVNTLKGAVNILVTADPQPEGVTIDGFSAAMMQGIKSEFGDRVKVLSNGPVADAGSGIYQLDAEQVIQEKGEKPLTVRQLMRLFVSGGKGWSIVATLPQEWYPEFEKPLKASLDSIKVKTTTATAVPAQTGTQSEPQTKSK